MSETLINGDTAYMLICMALVNLMTPGLAFFYGGLVRSSNVLSIMAQNYASMGLMTIIWTAWGYVFPLSFLLLSCEDDDASLLSPRDYGVAANDAKTTVADIFLLLLLLLLLYRLRKNRYSLCFGESQGDFMGNPKSHYFLENTNNNSPQPSIPGLVFCGFQGMFAVIAPALMTGAFADRVNFGPYMVFIALWAHLVYFPVCHWIWGGGWMAKQGVWDFAGGIVIHVTAGFSALATVVALPSRHHLDASVENKPHNIPFVALGTGLLWFGWFGFNGGSALGANNQAAYASINSEISASAALFGWMMFEWVLEGKPTLIGACVGAIAGLATITPAAGFVDPWSALLIGFLCVPFCYACIEITKRYKLDDALDVWAVHGMGGFLGTVCVGIFATEKVSGNVDASGKQFLIQLLAASGIAVYSFVIGYLLIKVIDKFSKVAVDADTYAKGLDVSIHGHEAYFDSSNDGSKKVVGV